MKNIVIVGSLAVLVFCLNSIASAENHIGILLDGYQKNCTVYHKGEAYDCEEARELYAGDTIAKKPDIGDLTIKWAPYASGKTTEKTSLTVVFDPPKDKKGVVQNLRELWSFVKTSHAVVAGATRASLKKIPPQPYNNATLIAGQKTTFTWGDSDSGYVLFKDSGGREIFRKDFGEESFLELAPEQVSMKHDETYTCIIHGTDDSRQFRLRLLSSDIAEQVAADLGRIETETQDHNDRLIQKALYLQFISDAYPQDVDLYWRSYMELEKIENEKMLKDDDRNLLDDLRTNYLRHARDAAKGTL